MNRSRNRALNLTLLQALPKSDAMDLIVQKAAELGARALVPVHTEFSVVKLDAERSERRLEHWRRIAQSACEQCGRHQPPRIEPPAPLAAALAALPGAGSRFALDPSAEQALGEQTLPARELVVAIGPEGGFGAADWRRLDAAQFTRVALGPRILRAETAALAVCAIAQSRWGDLAELARRQTGSGISAIIFSRRSTSGISGYSWIIRARHSAGKVVGSGCSVSSPRTSGLTRTSCGKPCVRIP